MRWICLLFYISAAVIGKAITRKWSNLLSVFAAFYAVMIFLANLHLYSMYLPSDQTILVLIVGIVSYSFGYVVFKPTYRLGNGHARSYHLTEDHEINDDYAFNKRLIIILTVLVTAFSLYRFGMTVLQLASGKSFIQIRNMYFNDDESSFGISRIDLFLFLPLHQALIIIATILFYTKTDQFSQKESRILLVFLLFDSVIGMFSNGGRENVFYFFLIFAFTNHIAAKDRAIINRISEMSLRRRRRIVRRIGVVVVIGLTVMTLLRSSTGESSLAYLFRKYYFYFSGWVPHLSYRLSLVNSGDYTHGYAFVLGLLRIPVGILRWLGMKKSEAYLAAESITGMLQERVNIGGGHTFNAYVSLFYYFYRDFGILSLIFESFLFGAFCSKTEKAFNKNPNLKTWFWYLFAFFLIISSMVRWEMVHVRTAMIVYYSVLFFKRNKKRGSQKMIRN